MAEKGLTTAVISIMGKLDPSVQKSVNKATKGMNGLKIAAVASAAAIGAAAIASAKKLLELGASFDSAYDTIRIGTGATGKALEGLKGDFEKVFSSMPTSTESAATAIADLNTRLGINGKTLQDVSKQAIYLSENLGAGNLQGIIEKTSQAFQGFGVQEEEMSAKMDYLFKVSQSTGIGYEDLASKVQQYALTFKDLGYSFEESAALIGQLEKAGVNTDQAMAAMRTSIGKLAAGGKSAAEGFEEYYEKIKNAASATDAANIAAEIFGTRNGAQMARAIRDGSLACGALVKELTTSTESIEGASLDTMDFAEKMQILKNKMSVSLAPLGNSVFDSINALMPLAEKGINALSKIIQKLGKNLPDIIPQIAGGVEKIMDVMDALLPTIEGIFDGIMEWGKQLAPTIKSLFGTISSIIKKIFPIIKNLVSKVLEVVGKIMPHITRMINEMLPSIQKILDAVMPLIDQILDVVSVVLPHILDIAMPIINGIVQMFSAKFKYIIETVSNAIEFIKKIFSGDFKGALDIFKAQIFSGVNYAQTLFNNIVNIVDNVIAKISEKFPAIGAVLQKVRDDIQPVIDNIKNIFGGVTDFVTNIFSGNWKAAWESVKDIFKNIFDGLAGLVKVPLNAIIGIVNKVIQSINSVGFTIPDWVPIVGGKAFSLNIPELPTFAQGGIATGPSIVGEGGFNEYVLSTDPKYRARNINLLGQAADALGATTYETTNNSHRGHSIKIEFAPVINCTGGSAPQDLIQALKSRMPEFVDMIQSALAQEMEGAY